MEKTVRPSQSQLNKYSGITNQEKKKLSQLNNRSDVSNKQGISSEQDIRV